MIEFLVRDDVQCVKIYSDQEGVTATTVKVNSRAYNKKISVANLAIV